ncbi:hypothetical protein P7C73_g1859, partial [Tremellales sp. Uapishka_1]
MSAPYQNTSLDGTTMNGGGNGKQRVVTPSNGDDELHRYVTDDVPRAAKAANRMPDTTGLITVQPLRKNEMQPSYAQDLGTSSIEHGVYGSMISGCGSCIGLLGAIPVCPVPNPYRSVDQGAVGLVSRFGQFYKSVDPGLVNVNVCSESIRIVDVKIQLTTVPRQNVQSKDNVTVEIDSVICWHVVSPYRAAFGINDVRNALIERAQTTLRQVVGSRVLQSVISDREGLAQEVTEIIEGPAEKWGVSIESILLKDINFSVDLQQSLSSAATQKRIGESKVIAARAEVDAAKLMRQAADILASPAAMQIRQLEALQNMARSASTKVVFVPMNLAGMGAAGVGDSVSQQIAASAVEEHGMSGGSVSSNAGMITAMSNV